MKQSKVSKLIYVAVGIISIFLVYSLVLIADDSVVHDEEGNIIELRESSDPGVKYVIDSYVGDINGRVQKNVYTGTGQQDIAAIPNFGSGSPTGSGS